VREVTTERESTHFFYQIKVKVLVHISCVCLFYLCKIFINRQAALINKGKPNKKGGSLISTEKYYLFFIKKLQRKQFARHILFESKKKAMDTHPVVTSKDHITVQTVETKPIAG